MKTLSKCIDTSLLRYYYMYFQPITSKSQRLGTQVALPTWFTDHAIMDTRLKCTLVNVNLQVRASVNPMIIIVTITSITEYLVSQTYALLQLFTG